MNVIALLASPHGLKGNTAGLLNIVLAGAEAEGARTETVVLPGGTVLPCRSCYACHKTGRCVVKDEFEPLKKKLLAADGIVLASPNYIFNVSAQLKALMDRCSGIIHCMAFWGKYGASVVTSGGGDEKAVAALMNRYLVVTGAVPVGAAGANMSAMPAGDFTPEVKENARALGRKLVRAWRAETVPAGVAKRRDDFRERMLSLMKYRAKDWPYEVRYWKEKRGVAI